MNYKISLTISALVIFISACSTKPPQPPVVKGEYRPVNQVIPEVANTDIPRIFDIKFKGTISDALKALQTKQPQFVVLPAQGREAPIKVELDLKQVSLESAIKVLAIQAAGNYEIVYKNDPAMNTDTAYIKFLKK